MIQEKIEAAAMQLNELAGHVDEETWTMIKNVRNELFDAAEQAMQLEACTIANQSGNPFAPRCAAVD